MEAASPPEVDLAHSGRTEAVRSRRADALVPLAFLIAAAVLVAALNSINVGFRPRPAETFALIAIGAAVAVMGAWRSQRLAYMGGSALLLVVVALCIGTQPAQLDQPVEAVWPLRGLIVLIVLCGWGILLGLTPWWNRAVLAFGLSTALALFLWGGPTQASLISNPGVRIPGSNFAPYWLAVDTRGTLYATDLDGGPIWVIDSGGNPRGMIDPGLAPAVPTPGPGIVSPGYSSELALISPSGSQAQAARRLFPYCGVATDPARNLYTIDLTDPAGMQMLRFDSAGNITARWPVPPDYFASSGCIAADESHIYLNSNLGRIFVFDKDGKRQSEVNFNFTPLQMTLTAPGRLVVLGANQLDTIDVAAGTQVTATLPVSPALQVPFLPLRNGQVLFANHDTMSIDRYDPASGKVVGTLGGPGRLPGQFGAIGSMVEDAQGRVYVADFGNRVIHRFGPDGQLDAVWWAVNPGERRQEGDGE